MILCRAPFVKTSEGTLNGEVASGLLTKAEFTLEDLRLSANSCTCRRILESGSRGCFVQHGINESTILRVELEFSYPYADKDLHTDNANKSSPSGSTTFSHRGMRGKARR